MFHISWVTFLYLEISWVLRSFNKSLIHVKWMWKNKNAKNQNFNLMKHQRSFQRSLNSKPWLTIKGDRTFYNHWVWNTSQSISYYNSENCKVYDIDTVLVLLFYFVWKSDVSFLGLVFFFVDLIFSWLGIYCFEFNKVFLFTSFFSDVLTISNL